MGNEKATDDNLSELFEKLELLLDPTPQKHRVDNSNPFWDDEVNQTVAHHERWWKCHTDTQYNSTIELWLEPRPSRLALRGCLR